MDESREHYDVSFRGEYEKELILKGQPQTSEEVKTGGRKVHGALERMELKDLRKPIDERVGKVGDRKKETSRKVGNMWDEVNK